MYEDDTAIQVLLVDDDSQLLEFSAMQLDREADRLTTLTETSADAGLTRVADDQIDCIVSDYQMPGMDGLEFLEAVRAEYPALPFILFTGKGSEEIAAQAINAGVDAYHQKETGTGQYTVLAQHVTTLVEKARVEHRLTNLEGNTHADHDEETADGPDGSDEDESVSMSIVDAIATREGVSPGALDPPLTNVLDTTALDTLFASLSGDSDERTGAVAFTYHSYTVTAYNTGHVTLDKTEG